MPNLRHARASLAVLPALLALLAAPAAHAVEARPALVTLAPPPAAASGAGGALDPEAATRAYLDTLGAEARSRSDAYFEGGYWLQLWEFLWGAAALLLLLATGASARARDWVERRLRRRPLQVAACGVAFFAATFVLGLPLEVYAGFYREHRYGLSNMTFGGWLGDQLKGLLVAAVLGSLALVVLYAVVRRAPRTWWLWGGVVAAGFMAVAIVITPVLLEPLFNTQTRLDDPRVVQPILSMARASGFDAREVWEIDESRQSTRVSAHVAGFLGTQRIALNDNLLTRCSLAEIQAVMGHELGHAVLHHPFLLLLELGLVTLGGFAVVAWAFERLRRRYAARWRVRDVADPAGLPLAVLLFSAYLFLTTPLTNTIVRVHEQEADYYGLNAARQPDGFAQVALKLAAYRKLEPGPLEELLFYDHPSGHTRILTAMRWKAEHPETWQRAP